MFRHSRFHHFSPDTMTPRMPVAGIPQQTNTRQMTKIIRGLHKFCKGSRADPQVKKAMMPVSVDKAVESLTQTEQSHLGFSSLPITLRHLQAKPEI